MSRRLIRSLEACWAALCNDGGDEIGSGWRALGGLVGTWTMSEAQRVWTLAIDGEAPESAAGKHDARDWQERSEGRNSNEVAAQTVAARVIGRRLDREELGAAAAVMHYSFGIAVGALYGGSPVVGSSNTYSELPRSVRCSSGGQLDPLRLAA